jgi:hypothetical protein
MKLIEELRFAQIVSGITSNINFSNRAEFIKNLGCSLNPVNLNVLLSEVLNSLNNLSNNDRVNILTGMFSSSEVGLKAALNFINTYHVRLNA